MNTSKTTAYILAKFKRAFTMMELIFAIVIIGLLAAIAIPKINATREDAEFVAIAANIKQTITEAITYYTATGDEFFWLMDVDQKRPENKNKFGVFPFTTTPKKCEKYIRVTGAFCVLWIHLILRLD